MSLALLVYSLPQHTLEYKAVLTRVHIQMPVLAHTGAYQPLCFQHKTHLNLNAAVITLANSKATH